MHMTSCLLGWQWGVLSCFGRLFVSLSHSATGSGLILKTPPPLLKLFGGNLLLGAFVLMPLLMTMITMEVTTIITEPWPLTGRLSCARLCDLHYVSLGSSPSFKAGHPTPNLQMRPAQVTSRVKSPCGTSQHPFPLMDSPLA